MIWLALILYLAAVGGGIGFAVLRGLGLWRALKRTGGALSAETTRITRVVDGLPAHIDRMNASVRRLKTTTGRIAASRARLDVQVRAIRETRATIGRLLWFVPGA